MKYHTLFLSKTRKDVAKFVVCCSRDWRFKGLNSRESEWFRVLVERCIFIGSLVSCLDVSFHKAQGFSG